MPTNLSKKQVGIAEIESGTKMTMEQWEMNSLVDEHAKIAAQQVRHPEHIVKGHLSVMRRVAWIGRATFAASNGNEEPYRDVAPTQAGGEGKKEGRESGARRKKGQEEMRIQARPVQ